MNTDFLTYSDSGSGLTLVFLHGFCESKDLWSEFVLPLANQFRVITIDLPGHGQSAISTDFSMEYQAQKVRETLEHLRVDDFLLVGHSMGGYVSLAFAEKFPEMLRGLVLFHSSALADSQEKKENRTKSMEFVQKHGLDTFMDSFVAPMFSAAHRDDNQANIHKMQDIGKATALETVIGCLKAMRDRPDRTGVLKAATYPVLFIVGKDDAAVPLEATLQQCHLPANSMTYFMAEVGHMGMLEKTAATRKALLKFAETLS